MSWLTLYVMGFGFLLGLNIRQDATAAFAMALFWPLVTIYALLSPFFAKTDDNEDDDY
jgi:hypothetical protein